MPHTEKTLETKEIFNGHVIRVTHDKVLLENGDTSYREVVHHHGGACVLALTDDDRVPLRPGRRDLGTARRQAGSGGGPLRSRQAGTGRGMRRHRRAVHRPGLHLPHRGV